MRSGWFDPIETDSNTHHLRFPLRFFLALSSLAVPACFFSFCRDGEKLADPFGQNKGTFQYASIARSIKRIAAMLEQEGVAAPAGDEEVPSPPEQETAARSRSTQQSVGVAAGGGGGGSGGGGGGGGSGCGEEGGEGGVKPSSTAIQETKDGGDAGGDGGGEKGSDVR